MFLLECEAHVSSHCLGKVGAATGAIDEFICIACLADKAFGGKDGPATGHTVEDVLPNVPAIPGSPPSPSQERSPGDLLFTCPSCRRVKAWHLQREPWPSAVCQDCFRASRPRAEGSR